MLVSSAQPLKAFDQVVCLFHVSLRYSTLQAHAYGRVVYIVPHHLQLCSGIQMTDAGITERAAAGI